MQPLVSIISLTYNHEPFIRDALEGFLMQKTNFPYEVIIHDDASTDNTQAIIKEYERQYPNIIKPIYQIENQKSKEAGLVTKTAYGAASGKYIALCEGDDYWTKPNKLQLQVDFLESNPDFVISFHNTAFLFDDGRMELLSQYDKEVYTLDDLLERNFIATASCVFKSNLFGKFPDWFFKLPFGDWSLHILNAQYGKIKYHNSAMAVYRIHSGGVWSSSWSIKPSQKTIESIYGKIKFYKYINIYFDFRYKDIINERINELYYKLLKTYLAIEEIKIDIKVIKHYIVNNFLSRKYPKKILIYSLKKYLFDCLTYKKY